ncbi:MULTISPECIES: phosphomevalonate kinase [Streptomyces]|uniref:phosphomevalonate kinase n=1 Tax=Streptomyces TaxID=1883 RepID=UPI000E688FFC|nr:MULTISPECIES: phosphomevalonate kinase [Streptomyces]MDX3064370.1 phosphomevalonate kinase [Streptomyces sp. ND04-05B]MDX3519660.1 phosphomevalonate kinase [Streptomyces scabiei]
MTRTVVRRAPGKLFVVGEYAVLEPGSPAVLAAVDREVTVSVTPADHDLVITSDLADQSVRLSRTANGFLAGAGPRQVVSAVEVVAALLAEWDLPVPRVELSIHSGLHDGGVKFGLGSSGAVTVATISAMLAYCGVSLCAEERFRLALLATALLDARASGGDLAASTWGGWILYRAPDRTAVLDLARRKGLREALRAPWPGFEVRQLPPPRELTVAVGWTGQPASTSDKLSSRTVQNWRGSAAHREFVRGSDVCVDAVADALEHGNDRLVLEEIRRARRLLAHADSQGNLGIFTNGLTALCDAAEAVGGAAKPSGAGGGDCGIALLEPDLRAIHRLRARWLTAGVVPLQVRMAEAERTSTGDQ